MWIIARARAGSSLYGIIGELEYWLNWEGCLASEGMRQLARRVALLITAEEAIDYTQSASVRGMLLLSMRFLQSTNYSFL